MCSSGCHPAGVSLRGATPGDTLLEVAASCADRLRRLADHLVETDVRVEVLTGLTRHLDAALDELAPLGPAPVGASREAVNRAVGAVHGVANAFAPPLAITHLPDRAEGRCVLTGVHEGPAGFAHGGVGVLLMDELCAQVPELLGTERVTVAMTVNYRRPVPLRRQLLLVARLREEDDLVEVTMATEMEPEAVLMHAEAKLVRLRPDQVERFRRAAAN
jgi:acyl-coenzyme A thioesterase PaaI-like protein